MIKYLILITLLIAVKSGSQDLQTEKDALKQVDLDFSNMSKENGMREAFLAYIAGDGVLLRPNSYPIIGYEKAKEYIGEDNPNQMLIWEPLFADVSASIDFGYTYGLYQFIVKDEQGNSTVYKGTYVSIWKKDKSGTWKFVLDTGNPGLEPKK
jgi:ketosteroid isomerase-like protein